MIDENEFINYWNYFLFIDEDLLKTNRYIQHDIGSNEASYSSEFARIILTSCAEIDTICRLLCKEIDPTCDFSDATARSGKINDYGKIILGKYPKLPTTEIFFNTLNVYRKPWDGWKYTSSSVNQSPQWWRDYQKIKHYRHIHFQDATLSNALLSTSALFVLLMYLHKTVFGYTNNIHLDDLKCFFSLCELDINEDAIDFYEKQQLPDFSLKI